MFGWRRRESELDEELAAHLRMHTEELVQKGMPQAQAVIEAEREFGNRLLVTEAVRRQWGWTRLEEFWADLRYGWRTLRAQPGFTTTAVLALSLGIAAATTMFSVLYGVLIDPFPYKDANRLVLLSVFDLKQPGEGGRRRIVNAAEAREYSRNSDLFEGVAYSMVTDASVDREGVSYPLSAVRVSGDLFDFIGIRTFMGRGLKSQDSEPGAPAVAVLSEAAWRKYFGSQPLTDRQIVRIEGRPYSVIGVSPKRYAWFDGDVWFADQSDFITGTNPHGMRYMQARLRPGARIEAVTERLTAISSHLKAIAPDSYPAKWQVRGVYCVDDLVGPPFRRTLYILLAAVTMLLLISCGNVAVMLLSRATARQREIGVRMALGASRLRIVRQLLAEGLLLGFGSAALGCAVAFCAIRALPLLLPPHAFANESVVELNVTVLVFSLGVSLLTVLFTTLAPALHLARFGAIDALRTMGKSAVDLGRHQLTRDIFVGVQIGMTLVLMLGAGLLIKAFAKSLERSPQVDPKTVVSAFVMPPAGAFQNLARLQGQIRTAENALRNLPGVRAVGQRGGNLPVEVRNDAGVRVRGLLIDDTEGVLEAAGDRILEGRWFARADVSSRQHSVAVVNETMARAISPGQSPVGQHLSITVGGAPKPVDVIGVLRDVPNEGFRKPTQPDIHVTELVIPPRFLVRTIAPASPPVDTIRRELLRSFPGASFETVQTFDELLASDLGPQRFTAGLLAIFSATALLLVLVGLYGVTSYAVAQRNYELGIRIALGASFADVLRTVGERGIAVVALGIVSGIAASAAAVHFVGALLGPVPIYDPMTYATVTTVLAGTALLMILIPASRSNRLDPAAVLRHE